MPQQLMRLAPAARQQPQERLQAIWALLHRPKQALTVTRLLLGAGLLARACGS
jgi:hypothetical protein